MSSAAFAGTSFPPDAAPPERPARAAAHAVRRGNPAATRIGLPLRTTALIAALLVHALALLWISAKPVEPVVLPVLMQATLIAPEPLPVAPPEPPKVVQEVVPEPPKPVKKPVPKRKEVALPKLVAKEDAPSVQTAPPQAPPPPEPVAIDAAPAAPVAPAPAPVSAAPVVAPPPPVSPPRFNADYLVNPAPAYPPMSRRMGEEGRVLLRVMVEADGTPSSVEVRTSSGFPRLDRAAQEAVRKWKFVPARRGEDAVAGAVNVPIDFGLRG
ncbi:MAG: energy transducer TonB [Gammaproteobacteria bacterium]|jgi:periplasmic protein TonB|nr:energy transducer TonB [Gammaproteobacteria bacterium]MBU0771156.1 energy transducer TonB [Gammaproteobacteria bacterium]MBU0855823.1 energy transducer TonB [Gammaproteobacteria bacterium]MBU1849031.1 energy transducer TonB [Gammaproteobacteria bacterium]